MELNDERKIALARWLLVDCGLENIALDESIADASTRRYFRVYTPQGSVIAMDAPPEYENCLSYIAIANALREHGLKTPKILASNIARGFLLISDFGDLNYLKVLKSHNADDLYQRALSTLTVIQNCKTVPGRDIPLFTREFMWQEWMWHKEWFLGKLLKLNLNTVEKNLDHCYREIVESAATQPQVFMHRDFHSGNLMLLPDNDVGLLDFQDAFIGPLTYDVVSLLRDCYIDWPEEKIKQWTQFYFQKLTVINNDIPFAEFQRMFDWMGLQRHLKALFTFARKHIRDQQTEYLHHVPRVLSYLENVSGRYSEFDYLHQYLRTTITPAFEREFNLCEA